jgi:DNA-binding Xre family transcriptional regulator
VKEMKISYTKLWKLLLDKKLKKQDLCNLTGISPATIAKLGKGDNINTDVLLRICEVLNCDIIEIMELQR